MSARHRRTVKLSHGYSCEFSFKLGEHFECRWSPDIPPPEIGRQLLPNYLRERNAFLASTGVPMMVIDL